MEGNKNKMAALEVADDALVSEWKIRRHSSPNSHQSDKNGSFRFFLFYLN